MPAKKYRKRPVVVEVVRWNGNNPNEVRQFVGSKVNFNKGFCRINTLEGSMYANAGDYIIKGVKGEFYPCKPDIFDETYELEP